MDLLGVRTSQITFSSQAKKKKLLDKLDMGTVAVVSRMSMSQSESSRHKNRNHSARNKA